MESRLNDVRRRLETWGGNRILFVLLRLVPHLSEPFMIKISRVLCALVPRISSRHFQIVCADIAQALQLDPSSAEVRRIADGSYRNLGESMVEFLRLPYMSAEQLRRWARLDGVEHLDAARARGKGIILLTAHLATGRFAAR